MVFLHHAFPHDPTFWTNFGLPVFLARVVAGIGATGAFGVSLFFVLSSYLITELLLREKDLMGTLDVRSFYIRRILRIWPLYFAFLALAVALQWIVPGQQVTWRAGVGFHSSRATGSSFSMDFRHRSSFRCGASPSKSSFTFRGRL